jgi:hypothetical protein
LNGISIYHSDVYLLSSCGNTIRAEKRSSWHDPRLTPGVSSCAADERRYAEQCEVYERANPGWKAFQVREAAARAARAAARKPPAPPLSAEELSIKAW